MKRVHIYIFGKVQGVFYRAHTQREATLRNVTGWVRNMSDGRVEAVFEGNRENVSEMIAWCRQGPKASSVKNITVFEEPYGAEFNDFSIRY